MSSLSLTVPDFPSSIAWECGLLFEVRKREKLVIAVSFFALLMLSDFTFLFCQGRPRNVRSCKTHKLSHCSIHEFFLFCHPLVAIAVVESCVTAGDVYRCIVRLIVDSRSTDVSTIDRY